MVTVFFIGTQLNTSFVSREFTHYRWYVGDMLSDWVFLLDQEATQAGKFHFLPSWNSKGEWCHQLGTLRGLNGSLIALTSCFLLCGLFWMNFKSLTDSRKHIHSIFFSSGKLREPAHCSPWPLWCEELRACRRTLCCLKFCISHNLMSSLCDKLEVLLWLLKQ